MPTESKHDTQAEREAKTIALSLVFSTCPGGERAAEGVEVYLFTLRNAPVCFVEQACNEILEQWDADHHYTAPSAADILIRARKFRRAVVRNNLELSESQYQRAIRFDAMPEARRIEAEDEMKFLRADAGIGQHDTQVQVTPEIIRSELEAPRCVDPDPVIEAKRIASLRRVLAVMDGNDQPPAPTRKRGEGGLRRLSEEMPF